MRAGGPRRGPYLVNIKQRPLGFLERGGYVDEIGRSNLFVSKSKALSHVYRTLDHELCSRCTLRVFRECSQFGLAPIEENEASGLG